MDLSVITVTWNSKKNIAEQIRSVVSGCSDISFEQIIIDNHSLDKTADLIREDFPGVKLIVNSENKGFAAANNQGLAAAQGQFILFLNPDMLVTPGSIGKIVEWLKNRKDVGLVSCKLVDRSGKFNNEATPRSFPKLFDQLLLTLKIPHLLPGVLNKYFFTDFNPDLEQEVDSVRGAFMLVRREILDKLGWAFDPRYYIWFEDVDLCQEVKSMGFKVMYTPIISCIDLVGQSFKQSGLYWKQKNFTASMVKYFKKWQPWWQWPVLALSRPFILSLAWLVEKFFLR